MENTTGSSKIFAIVLREQILQVAERRLSLETFEVIRHYATQRQARLTGRLMEKPVITNMSKVLKSTRDKARTSPGSGAQRPHLSSVDSMRGLPRSERPWQKKLVRIGTLNVGSLTGKSRKVADLMKRRNIQVLCLQETRWKGAKAREIGEGVKLFYNGEDTKRNGVAVAVADSLKDSVSAVNRVSSRIISLSLDETIRSVPEGDYLTIAGDLNGHVGSERRGLERVHGGKGVGVRNVEGERVLALAIAHDSAVCSTFFAKRKSQKVTYSSGGKETEIDHVLVRRSSLKTVKDIKVLPGEDLAPQHRPLLADIAIDLPKKSRTRTERRIR
uniref:Endo/exonuclease/phosphatase domain-containing protein n=1 Tax=Haemonchus contortus TaxID=6289 RepID=A0A7I4XUC2_HAECO